MMEDEVEGDDEVKLVDNTLLLRTDAASLEEGDEDLSISRQQEEWREKDKGY